MKFLLVLSVAVGVLAVQMEKKEMECEVEFPGNGVTGVFSFEMAINDPFPQIKLSKVKVTNPQEDLEKLKWQNDLFGHWNVPQQAENPKKFKDFSVMRQSDKWFSIQFGGKPVMKDEKSSYGAEWKSWDNVDEFTEKLVSQFDALCWKYNSVNELKTAQKAKRKATKTVWWSVSYPWIWDHRIAGHSSPQTLPLCRSTICIVTRPSLSTRGCLSFGPILAGHLERRAPWTTFEGKAAQKWHE